MAFVFHPNTYCKFWSRVHPLSLLNDPCPGATSHNPCNGLKIAQGCHEKWDGLLVQGMSLNIPIVTAVTPELLTLSGTSKGYRMQ